MGHVLPLPHPAPSPISQARLTAATHPAPTPTPSQTGSPLPWPASASTSPLNRIGQVLALLVDVPTPVEVIAYTPAELAQRSDRPFIRQLLAEGKTLYPQDPQ